MFYLIFNELAGFCLNAKVELLDEELYKERFSVERTNAWIDAFKAILVRFEVLKHNFKSLHYLAFSLILLRRVKPSYF